jgi:hemoglobin
VESWFAGAVSSPLPDGDLLYVGKLPAAMRARRRWLRRPRGAAGPETPICAYFYQDAPKEYRDQLPAPGSDGNRAFLAAIPAVYRAQGYQPLRELLLTRVEDLTRVPLPDGDELCAGVLRDDRSLYERLGGSAACKAVAVGADGVLGLYDRILADPELATYFRDVDLARQKRHFIEFVVQATGGPKVYTGRRMREAHARHNIPEDHFNKVAGHLVETLRALGVDETVIEELVAAIAPLKPDIVAGDGLAEPA